MTKKIKVIIFLFALQVPISSFAKQDFPGRTKYPTVPTIELNAFYNDLLSNKAIAVDARNPLEHQIIHVKNSVNEYHADQFFIRNMKKIRSHNPDKKIVFYCNGINCNVSYLATQKAMKAKIKNVFAYDSGIFNWAKSYPKSTVLMGKEPSLKNSLISKESYNEHVLDFNDFDKLAKTQNVMILDIRDQSASTDSFL
ncbi:MAG: rhodanese-like domain-containing protein [gamma proteobacterium symbiont of Bathyaustriella thionipta]|nr:rhodanese-like domain-containing protein [gamma proteobacterium symbiont of Bathyaustriella thionipta]MCU7954645.1 rhodanese-like domain-containing protein [gamma proteobacterium symbiont of Bathyaustriella thionipta]MCU7957439.1 rhodanese-like domain-containing protein [gamma proteobacterium symbiont of Bathyaustriella thionipta]MCU7966095.1 rhodanese-like domain-containing protein [gamma proteobacterium symbiont of Bathyaustriella thionipta]